MLYNSERMGTVMVMVVVLVEKKKIVWDTQDMFDSTISVLLRSEVSI